MHAPVVSKLSAPVTLHLVDSGMLELSLIPIDRAIRALSPHTERKGISSALETLLTAYASVDGLTGTRVENLLGDCSTKSDLHRGVYQRTAARASGLITSFGSEIADLQKLKGAAEKDSLAAVTSIHLASTLLNHVGKESRTPLPQISSDELALLTSVFEPSPTLIGDFCRVMHNLYDKRTGGFSRDEFILEAVVGNRGSNVAPGIVNALTERSILREKECKFEVSPGALALWHLLKEDGQGIWYCTERKPNPVQFALSALRDSQVLAAPFRQIVENLLQDDCTIKISKTQLLQIIDSSKIRLNIYQRLGLLSGSSEDGYQLTEVGAQVATLLDIGSEAVKRMGTPQPRELLETERPHPDENSAIQELGTSIPEFETLYPQGSRLRTNLVQLLLKIPRDTKHITLAEMKLILEDLEAKYTSDHLRHSSPPLLFTVAPSEYLLTFRAQKIERVLQVARQTIDTSFLAVPTALSSLLTPTPVPTALPELSREQKAEQLRERFAKNAKARIAIGLFANTTEMLSSEFHNKAEMQGLGLSDRYSTIEELLRWGALTRGDSTDVRLKGSPSVERATLKLTDLGKESLKVVESIEVALSGAKPIRNDDGNGVRNWLRQ